MPCFSHPTPVPAGLTLIGALLSDSFSKKPCLRVLISFFVFEYFFTGSAIADRAIAADGGFTHFLGSGFST